MADIEIVIKIPEEMYAEIMDINGIDTMLIPYTDIVRNGTPLPKVHGRLIDADAINLKDISPINGFSVYGATAEDIDLTPTMLEAESEVEEND